MKFLNIILFFVSISLKAQEIPKFEFENYSPIWSHYSSAEDLSTNIQALNLTPSPIITNEHLYITSNIFDKTTLNGHLSEKINIKTGERIWSNFYYSTLRNTREYAQSPIIENGVFNINVYKEIMTPNVAGGIFWSKSILMKRNYNDISGLELDSLLTDSLDGSNTILNIPESIVSNLKTVLVQDGNNTRYTRVVPDGMNYLFTTKLLNNLGHQIDSIGLEIKRSQFSPRQIRTFPNGDGGNLFLITSQNSIDSQSVRVVILDKELNFLQNEEVVDFLPKLYEEHILHSVNEDNFFIISYKSSDVSSLYDIIISKLNKQLELLEKITFTKVPLSIGLLALQDQKTLVSFAKEENNQTILYFYKSNDQGETSLIKELKLVGTNNLIFVKNIYLTPNADILVNITHIDKNSNVLPIPKWANWTLIKGTDLGIVSASNDQYLSSFNLYPNPITNILNIQGIDQDVNFKIYNIQGEIINQGKSVAQQIDTHLLPSGLYIFEIQNEQGIERHKVLKIE